MGFNRTEAVFSMRTFCALEKTEKFFSAKIPSAELKLTCRPSVVGKQFLIGYSHGPGAQCLFFSKSIFFNLKSLCTHKSFVTHKMLENHRSNTHKLLAARFSADSKQLFDSLHFHFFTS